MKLLEKDQLVAVALRYGVVAVRVIDYQPPCFSIDPRHYNIPRVWSYEDEGLYWSRDVSQESRDALFAAAQLARSA